MSDENFGLEYREGTPSVQEHEAHAGVGESGERYSAWRVLGLPNPFVTFDGDHWFEQLSPVHQIVPLGAGVLTPRSTPNGLRWCPADVNTFEAVPWRTPSKYARPLRETPDGPIMAWMCTNERCSHVYQSHQRRIAEQCHGPHCCEWVESDGSACYTFTAIRRVYCAEHERAAAELAERERFEKAEHIPVAAYTGGWLYTKADPTVNAFFESYSALSEHFQARNLPVPRYAWGVERFVPETTAEDVIENALSEHHEDASSEVNGRQRALLDDFLKMWWNETRIYSLRTTDVAVIFYETLQQVTP